MKFADLLSLIGNSPLFETSVLFPGPDSPAEIHRQLCRWVNIGRIHQLRRGLYVLAGPYARTRPDPFVLASRIRQPSYISLQSALSRHGLIPESVPRVTSVTTGRPQTIETVLGGFHYRHVNRSLFHGYVQEVSPDGSVFYMATPEKALLDLFHLTPGKMDRPFLEELRLDPDGRLDLDELEKAAMRTGKPKLLDAARTTVLFLKILRSEKVIAL